MISALYAAVPAAGADLANEVLPTCLYSFPNFLLLPAKADAHPYTLGLPLPPTKSSLPTCPWLCCLFATSCCSQMLLLPTSGPWDCLPVSVNLICITLGCRCGGQGTAAWHKSAAHLCEVCSHEALRECCSPHRLPHVVRFQTRGRASCRCCGGAGRQNSAAAWSREKDLIESRPETFTNHARSQSTQSQSNGLNEPDQIGFAADVPAATAVSGAGAPRLPELRRRVCLLGGVRGVDSLRRQPKCYRARSQHHRCSHAYAV